MVGRNAWVMRSFAHMVCRYGELLLGMHHTLQATSEPSACVCVSLHCLHRTSRSALTMLCVSAPFKVLLPVLQWALLRKRPSNPAVSWACCSAE